MIRRQPHRNCVLLQRIEPRGYGLALHAGELADVGGIQQRARAGVTIYFSKVKSSKY
jgi:hypothetical protein